MVHVKDEGMRGRGRINKQRAYRCWRLNNLSQRFPSCHKTASEILKDLEETGQKSEEEMVKSDFLEQSSAVKMILLKLNLW